MATEQTVDFQAAVQTVSELNQRDHWAVKLRRKKLQQLVMLAALQNNLVGRHVAFPCVVTLTRIGPNTLDGDNLQSALKAVRDSIARKLGVDDGDTEKIRWEYSQMPVRIRQYGVKVSIRFS